jgi:outer membrane protein TolC
VLLLASVVTLLAAAPSVSHAGAVLPLERAIENARANDPWLAGSQHRQQSLEARGAVAGGLPEPTLRLGLANLPTDTFDFNQEAMTQFKFGVSQVFPRGDSRELEQRQLQILGSEHPYQRQDRQAKVAVAVTSLWLDTFRARQSIRLIERDRSLFEHLVDVAESSYSSTRGRIRQQDIIRAQLELTRLEDRLTGLREQQATSRSRLGEWLVAPSHSSLAQGAAEQDPQQPQEVFNGHKTGAADWYASGADWFRLPDELPQLPALRPGIDSASSPQTLAAALFQHPALLSLDARIDAGETGIELAEQQSKPQWRIDASYGYRDDDPMGAERADFFSVGVAFDMPFFSPARQQQKVRSARAETEAVRTDRALALRKMVAELASRLARLQRLEERRALYNTRLLREMREQADAALNAYTHDDGDFAEVVRAKIDQLNAGIEALDIEVERLKTISEINYFLTVGIEQSPGVNS